MEENKTICIYCDAEINEETTICPECGKIVIEEDSNIPLETEKLDEDTIEDTITEEKTERKPGFFRSLTNAHIALIAGVLCIGLIGGYFLSMAMPSLFSGSNKQLSGPWSGTVTFNNVTSANKEAETQLKSNLNQPNNIDMHIYMDSNNTGRVYIPGLNTTGTPSTVKITNNKLEFTIKSTTSSVSFEVVNSLDKASGDQKLIGTVKMDSTVDNGSGEKTSATFTGKMDMTQKKINK